MGRVSTKKQSTAAADAKQVARQLKATKAALEAAEAEAAAEEQEGGEVEEQQEEAAAADDDAAKPARRAHRWRHGTVALREIRAQQKSQKRAFRSAPFERVVREVAQDLMLGDGDDMRFRSDAIRALQEASEANLYNLFRRAYAITLYSGRNMIDVKDFHVSAYVRGESDGFPMRNEAAAE